MSKHVATFQNLAILEPGLVIPAFSLTSGRPYCAAPEGHSPYYCEAFIITVQVVSGRSKAGSPRWLVAVPCEEYFLGAFASAWASERERVSKARKRMLRVLPPELTEAPGTVLALGLQRMVAPVFVKKYRKIDLQLMKLRRREVLWTAWVLSSDGHNQSERRRMCLDIAEMVEKRWEDLYRHRPRW